MFVIVFSLCFGAAAGIYITATTPDARITKKSREAPFRGDLKNELDQNAYAVKGIPSSKDMKHK